MVRLSQSQSAPSLRVQTAPLPNRPDASLPSIWGSSPSTSPQKQRAGGSAASSNYGLFPKSSSNSMLHALMMHSSPSRRSNSPPRPGTTAGGFGSRVASPYLLSGLTDAAESSNYNSQVFEERMHEHEALEEQGEHVDELSKQSALSYEKDFHLATDGLEKSLKALHLQLDTFDPLHRGKSSYKKVFKNSSSQEDGDDEDEEGESHKERLEAYKMVRKIEPELPPLTRMPALPSSRRLPDSPMIEYNLSLEALAKWDGQSRKEASIKQKSHRETQMVVASTRRDNMLQMSTDGFSKLLAQKKKRAELVLAARRDGGGKGSNQAVPKDVVAEKWVVVFALASFLKSAREEVVFHRKPPDERMKVIKERQAAGIVKRTDAFHVRTVEMQELMKDQSLISRLEMLGRLFSSQRRIHTKRTQAHLVAFCLGKWRPKANIFLGFKDYVSKIKYLQDWWRRMSQSLKEVREKIAKRWEKIERWGTSGKMEPDAPCLACCEPIDVARRTVFLENELRSRRFFILSTIAMWEEDSSKWEAEQVVRKQQGLKFSKEFPARPSHLPKCHLFTESDKKPCREMCLGRQGDHEIMVMIKAARSNPKGGGWRPIPQKNAQSKQKGKKSGDGGDNQSDTPAAARLFGEADSDDLKRWGVRPGDMPSVGQKPGADEGEGRYP